MSPDSYEGCRRSVFVLAFELASVWKILARCMLPNCSVRCLQACRATPPKYFRHFEARVLQIFLAERRAARR